MVSLCIKTVIVELHYLICTEPIILGLLGSLTGKKTHSRTLGHTYIRTKIGLKLLRTYEHRPNE